MDFVTDPNPTPVFHAEQQLGFPDYVKDMDILQPSDLTKLASGAFANVHGREYPVHTKAATWLSAAYFFGSNPPERRDPRLEASIKQAAAFWEIVPDVDSLESLFNTTIKQAATRDEAPREYALAIDFEGLGGRGVESFYPINDDYEVKEASLSVLADYASERIPLVSVKEASTKILAAARKLGCTDQLPDKIAMFGEPRMADFEHAASAARLRVYAGVPEAVLPLYEEIVKGAAAANANLDDFVELWRALDIQHHVKYSHLIEDPYSAFYSGMPYAELEKVASSVVLIGDVMVPKHVVSDLNADTVAMHFRKEAQDKILNMIGAAAGDPKMASALADTLEQEEREALLELLAA